MSDRDSHGATPDEPVAAAPANPISLADVVALPVVPHWAESVAVVEALCALLSTGATESVHIPELPDVAITSRGTIIVRKGARGTTDVHELGRILYALLDPGSTPMALRLFAAHAMTSGSYATVDAYAEALGYYARPGRRELIRALYDRCLETPLEAPPAPSVSAQPGPVAPRRARGVFRWMRVLVLIALGAAGASAAAWAWSRDIRATAPAGFVGGPVPPHADGVPPPRSAPPAMPGAVAPTTGSRPAPRISPSPSRGASNGATIPAVAPVVVSQQGPRHENAVASDSALAGAPAIPPELMPLPALSLPMLGDEAVYDETSAGVQPPVLLYPRLPPFPVVPPRASGTNTMELLVDALGRVEHVRLVSEPVRMQDMTLLSAAKVWRFHPALKDGRRVRYRLSLSWIVSPP